MQVVDLGDVIATRSLSDSAKGDRKVVVSIGRPQRFPDSDDYYCPFQITALGRERVKYAAGVDAIQALQLVMKMIGAELEALERSTGGKLTWDGDAEEGELGFPRPSP
jgi:hypothetical protein